MRTTQRISPNAIAAFRDALSVVFWRKKDLLDYLRTAVDDPRLLDGIDWLHPDVYKRDSVRRLVDRLNSSQDRHGDLLLRVMGDVAAMDDFPQLAWLEDAELKIAAPVPPSNDSASTCSRMRRSSLPRLRRGTRSPRRPPWLIFGGLPRAWWRSCAISSWPCSRWKMLSGAFAFEPWLRKLFDTFDLDPKASFRVVGEQIDGGFTLDHTHFLLEARWRKELATREDLDVFRAKVQDNAENTLGVFVSVSGFETSAVSKHS